MALTHSVSDKVEAAHVAAIYSRSAAGSPIAGALLCGFSG
jgi:hypothetical protein